MAAAAPAPATDRTQTCSGYVPIGDYAIVGNSRSAALVSRGGSVDWLCWPRFDSPSYFGAILDTRLGGRFYVRPSQSFEARRRYVPDTNVLETTFETSSGVVTLRDCMPVASPEEHLSMIEPEHELLRELECQRGEVEIEVLYEPRPHYGSQYAGLHSRGALGIWTRHRGGVIYLRSDFPLQVEAEGHAARATTRLREGERAYLSLAYSKEAPAVLPVLGSEARRRIERTVEWWSNWTSRMAYEGPYATHVARSALTLKLMAYAPSGAVVAAPTTSLPETIGGERNWDYRYCWLRDASLTLRSLFSLGYHEEATAFLSWMVQATRLTWPRLQVVYDIFGESRLPEYELDYLEGYECSQPVRIGNAAFDQLQLDVYGEFIDAAAQFAGMGGRIDLDTARLLDDLGKTVCAEWREPDDGIWETRTERRHHTHSKVMCWVALDRLVRLHEDGRIKVNLERFRRERDAIRQDIEAHAWDDALESYTRTYDSDDMDASLLLMPAYGYRDGKDPRIRSTVARVLERLGSGSLIQRYELRTPDGLPPGEGAFGICSFWGVEARALTGDLEGAQKAFEELLSFANDVGLYAEEIDAETGAALGNFPQAFTHVGLINAALTLHDVAAGGRVPPAQLSQKMQHALKEHR